VANKPVLQEVLRQLGGSVVKPTTKFLAWLTANNIPETIVKQFSAGVLNKSKYARSVMIYSGDDIESVNSKGAIPIALRNGLLIVGSGPGGDPAVVDLQEHVGSAGYLCHETMWQASNVRAEYVRLAESLAELVVGIHQGTMPLDYFDAKDFLQCDGEEA